MSNAKQIAGLVGPSIVAIVTSESPLVQPHLYDAQIPPVVYLSGVLLFIGGLSIVRLHSRWARDWTMIVTLSGWGCLLLGFFRMFAAQTYRTVSSRAPVPALMVRESLLLAIGLFMTTKAYWPIRARGSRDGRAT